MARYLDFVFLGNIITRNSIHISRSMPYIARQGFQWPLQVIRILLIWLDYDSMFHQNIRSDR